MIEKKLCLYSAELVKFKDGANWKYIFITQPPYANPKDKWLVAWGADGIYEKFANDKLINYDEREAKVYPFKPKEFNGVVEEKLVEDPAYAE